MTPHRQEPGAANLLPQPGLAKALLEAGGRLELPAAIRRHLGVADGDLLVLDPQPDGTVTLIGMDRVLREARGLLRGSADAASVADELIAERRAEARREREEDARGNEPAAGEGGWDESTEDDR